MRFIEKLRNLMGNAHVDPDPRNPVPTGEALAALAKGSPMLCLVVQVDISRRWIYTDDEGRAYVGLKYASAKAFADTLLDKTGIEGLVINEKPDEMAATLRHEGIECVCILLDGETVELPVAMLNPAPVGGPITQRNAPLRRSLQRELQRACGQRAIKERTLREAHLSHPTPPLLLRVVPEVDDAVLFVLVQGQEDAPVTRVTRSAIRAMQAEYAQQLQEPGSAGDVIVLGALPPVADMKTLIPSSPVYCAVAAFTSWSGAWAARTEMKLPVAVVAATWQEIAAQARVLDGLVIDRMTLAYPVLAIDL